MRVKSRILPFIVSTLIVVVLFPTVALAETGSLAAGSANMVGQSGGIVASGKWGTCPWEIDEEGTLTVYPGNGASQTVGSDYETRSPWYRYSGSITQIVFASDNWGGKVYAGQSCNKLFASLDHVTQIDFSAFDTSRVTDMSSMFSGCSSLVAVNLFGKDVSLVRDMQSMFSECSCLQSLDLRNLNASSLMVAENMFYNCSSLQSIDLSKFKTTGKLKNTRSMFSGCTTLQSANLSGLKTSSVTDMVSMFCNCSSLQSLNLSTLDTSSVTATCTMFCNCSSLESIDLSRMNTSQVKNMSGMFRGCSSLQTLDLSSFNTRNVTNMEGMFADCSSLQSLNLSGWITSGVTTMVNMFGGCSSLLSLDLSGFDTSAINTNMMSLIGMFKGCDSLETIAVGRLGKKLSIFPEKYWRSAETGQTFTCREIYDSRRGIADVYTRLGNIEAAEIELEQASAVYDGTAKEPLVSISLDGKNLALGEDYDVVYSDNVNAGIATVNVVGKGGYAGNQAVSFVIEKADSPMVVTAVDDEVFCQYEDAGDVSFGSTNVSVSEAISGVTYANASEEDVAKRFTVNRYTGVLTIPKGTAAGSYTVGISATDAGDANHKTTSVTVVYSVVVRQAPSKILVSTVSESVFVEYDAIEDRVLDEPNISVSGAAGIVTYENNSDDPVSAAFSVELDTSFITVPAGIPEGAYNTIIAVHDAGDQNHLPTTILVEYIIVVSSEGILAGGTCGSGLTWQLTTDCCLIISGNGLMDDFEISASKPPWYRYKDCILSLTIEEGVLSVGDYAFADCAKLNSASLPDGLIRVGKSAFHGCLNLSELELPGSLVLIGDRAFVGRHFLSRILCSEEVASLIQPGMFSSDTTSIPFYSDGIYMQAFSGYSESMYRTIHLEVKSQLTFETWGEGASSWKIRMNGEFVAGGGSSGFAPEIVTKTLTLPAGDVDLELLFPSSATRYCRYSVQKCLDDAEVMLSGQEFEFNGSAICPSVLSVVLDGTELVEGDDYQVSYKNNVYAGTATVVIAGKGSYAGEQSITFEIVKADSPVTVSAIVDPVIHSFNPSSNSFKTESNIKVTGSKGTVTYENVSDNATASLFNVGLGTGFVTVPAGTPVGTYRLKVAVSDSGSANYNPVTRSAEYNVVVSPASASGFAVSGVVDKGFTGSAQVQKPRVTYDGRELRNGTDYTLSYKSNTNAGTATMTVTGKGNYTGEKSVTFKINPVSLATATVTPAVASYTYDGKEKTPGVTVKLGSKTLKENTDYTVSYSSNIDIGTATATVTGKGNYTGTAKGTFAIVQAPLTSVKRLAGSDRYETMSKIVAEGFTKSDYAVVATGANYPDALAANALAGAYGCPVVLTATGSLTGEARSTLQRLGVKKAFIMGGEAAVSKAVENSICGMGIAVERVAGASRQDTSLMALKKVKEKTGSVSTVIIATGYNFADTLSIGPWSYAVAAPIVLAQGNGTLTPAEASAIKELGNVEVIVVGGTAVVSDAVRSQLGRGFTRLAGADRYATSRAIADWELSRGLGLASPAVATGANYPDALAGAALCGSRKSVMVLTSSSNTSATAVLKGAKGSYIFGGTGAVSASVEAGVKRAVG